LSQLIWNLWSFCLHFSSSHHVCLCLMFIQIWKLRHREDEWLFS
jgi:hypothetical protein